MYDKTVDINADVRAINDGRGTIERSQTGELQVTVHGRTYAIEPNGTLSPRTGPGLHTLSRTEFHALGVYNKFGSSTKADMILDRMRVDPASRARALEIWALLQPE